MPRANIIKKEVQTQSGIELGNVVDVIVECDTQIVIQYIVSAGLLKKEKIIHRDQIIDITENKIIVDDATLLYSEDLSDIKNIAINPSAAAMREQL